MVFLWHTHVSQKCSWQFPLKTTTFKLLMYHNKSIQYTLLSISLTELRCSVQIWKKNSSSKCVNRWTEKSTNLYNNETKYVHFVKPWKQSWALTGQENVKLQQKSKLPRRKYNPDKSNTHQNSERGTWRYSHAEIIKNMQWLLKLVGILNKYKRDKTNQVSKQVNLVANENSRRLAIWVSEWKS